MLKAMRSESENVAEVQSLASRAQDLNRSTDFWNTLMIWALVAAALAAIAVGVTTYFALRRAKQLADVEGRLVEAKDAQREIELKDRDVKIAETGAKAVAAEAKAEQFRLNIAEANQQAEEAQQRAAEARLELAKLKTPRTLDSTHAQRVTAEAKQFAGTTFNIAAFNSKEPLNLVFQIEEILSAAGWKQLDWDALITINRTGRSSLGIAAETGVTIQVEFDLEAATRSRLLGIAKFLASALTKEGIAAEAQFMPLKTKNPESIHLVVGEKPM